MGMSDPPSDTCGSIGFHLCWRNDLLTTPRNNLFPCRGAADMPSELRYPIRCQRRMRAATSYAGQPRNVRQLFLQ